MLGGGHPRHQVGCGAGRQSELAAVQVAERHPGGTAYRGLGDHGEALRQYTAALRLARRSGWRESEATTLGNLGIVERKLGWLTGAVRHLEAALAIDRSLGRRAGVANNLGLLATVHCELGRLDEAAAQFAAALDLNVEIGSRGSNPQKRNVIVMLRMVTRIRFTAMDCAVAVPTSTGPPETR